MSDETETDKRQTSIEAFCLLFQDAVSDEGEPLMNAETSMTYREAFPDYGKLDVEIPDGFVDVSNPRYGCPSFACEELGLLLWIDYADSSKGGMLLEDHPRFTLQRATFNTQKGPHGWELKERILNTDEFSEILQAIDRERAVRRASAP